MKSTVHDGFGAFPQADGTFFRVAAPGAERVEVVLEPAGRTHPLEADGEGAFAGFVDGVAPGALYRYRLNGDGSFPDPASRYQPQGVHGPSQVVDAGRYAWRHEAWRGRPAKDLIFYELHVGTFTPEGSYAALARRLPYLADLGVSALELMPLADFPGRWNWGYDVAALYAPSRAYGTPDELRSLIDAAHGYGLAVFLDVVYNHLGPDGAYLPTFIPTYFTDRHATPWGQAVNLDGEQSEVVRALLLDNARYWLRDFRFDGLRLDATHALVDDSEPHLLAELSRAAAQLPGPRRYLVAEDERNLRRLLDAPAEGGYGLDAVWADDFHHQLRRRLAGDAHGYYRDFSGSSADLARTLEQGWFFTGQRAEHLGAARGSDPAGLSSERFVYCIQNHDQIGNRPGGDRLAEALEPSAYRAATALLLFLPQLPLLFMGQEWAAGTPFLYFTDHAGELGRQVSEGRRREFKDFPGFAAEVPDPQDPGSFTRSKLAWDELEQGGHARTLCLYRDLLALRKTLGGEVQVLQVAEGGLVLRRGRHYLALALEPGAELRRPAGREVWRSEAEAYSEHPAPPRCSGGVLSFPACSALIYEADDDR